MAGTIPLIIQVPASEPISNRIRIAINVEEIALRTPSIISVTGIRNITPISPATAAEINRAIWFGPYDESSP